jgi:hypothetical protein
LLHCTDSPMLRCKIKVASRPGAYG